MSKTFVFEPENGGLSDDDLKVEFNGKNEGVISIDREHINSENTIISKARVDALPILK